MTRPRSQRARRAAQPSHADASHTASPDTFRWHAILIFALALVMRLGHVWQISGSPFAEMLMGDARGYDAWGQRLAQGDWIGAEVFYQAPLYPYFLGAIYALAGHDLFLVRLVQALLGALAAAAIGIAGWSVFSARVGLVAGVLFALYPTAIFFDGLIQKSSLDGFFTCVALALIGQLIARDAGAGTSKEVPSTREVRSTKKAPSAEEVPSTTRRVDWRWLALGATFGAMALTRENALLLIAVIAIWALALGGHPAPGGHPFRGAEVATFALGLTLVLAPVALRNYAVGGGLYLTTSQFGPNFFIGNNAAADGTYMSLRFGRGAPEFERRDATELAEAATGRTLTPAEVSSYWSGRALAFITTEPGRWGRLMLRKAALLINVNEMLDTESQESHAEWSWPLRPFAWLLHFGVIVPLAVAGMIVAWPPGSRLWILYALTLTYAVSVVLFFVFARYRYPLAPFLILFAAVAIARAAEVILAPHKGVPYGRESGVPYGRESGVPYGEENGVPYGEEKGVPYGTGHDVRRAPLYGVPGSRATYATLAAVAGAAVIANWPMLSVPTMKAITETNLALALQENGGADRAIEHYRRAIQLDAAYAPAYNNLGTALRATGDYTGAIAAYERARALLPASSDILVNLGNARIGAGDLPGAVDVFRRAAESDPSAETRATLARATYDLGSALIERAAFADAEARLRESIALEPRNAEAHNNLGIALASQGRIPDAIAEFRKALEIQPRFADAERNLAIALQATKRE